jgi:hypothetical protein
MTRTAALLVAALALALPSAAAQDDKQGVKDALFFPLKVGNRWEYRVGARTLVTRVVKHELIDQQWCARLETKGDKLTTAEYVGVRADGVYRFRANGFDLLPPVCLFRLPPINGKTWQVKSRTAGQELQGSFKQAAETVTVHGKTYQALKVATTDYKVAGDKTAITTWYAPRVGMVKQVIRNRDVEILLELVKFEAGP